MNVPNNCIKLWNKYLDSGDKTKLAEYTGVSYPVILDAFKGEATADLIEKINQFFLEKKERIEPSFKK